MGRPRIEHRTDRKRPITVSVTPRDRATIEERAREAGLPLSVYVRSAALGRPAPRGNPVLNHEQMRILAQVNADQGRLGGLLKMWLADRPGRVMSEAEVRRLYDQIQALRVQLSEVAARL